MSGEERRPAPASGASAVPGAPGGPAVEPRLIATAEGLEEACRRWRACGVIGVDTEFVRERTFYPALGLIQVSDGNAHALIDAVRLEDLEPLAGVLQDPGVTKIFHSCGEDLEVLHHRFGAFPREVFDTQVAAVLTGWGAAPGYGRLVASLFDVELPKDKTRTNWLRRPLSDAERTYAALDVAYLIPAYHRLLEDLRHSGRETWAREELAPLFDAERFSPDPRDAYRRISAWRSLAPRQLAVLQRLARWRERQARRRDLPRNFVLHEKALIEVARKTPTTPEKLAAIDALGRRDVERHGETLLRHVRQALSTPPTDLPERQPLLDLTPYRRRIQRLRRRVAEVAEELSLPAEVLATRKTIESLVRRHVAGKTPVLPEKLRGWRREVVGEELLAGLGPRERMP